MTPDKTPADRLALLCSPEDVAGSSLYNLKAEMFEIAQASDASDYDFCDLFDWVKKLGQDIMEAIAVIKAKDKELADYRASKVEDDGLVERIDTELALWKLEYDALAELNPDAENLIFETPLVKLMLDAKAAITRLQSQSANPWVKIDDIPEEWKDGRLLLGYCLANETQFEIWCEEKTANFVSVHAWGEDIDITHARLPIAPPKTEE